MLYQHQEGQILLGRPNYGAAWPVEGRRRSSRALVLQRADGRPLGGRADKRLWLARFGRPPPLVSASCNLLVFAEVMEARAAARDRSVGTAKRHRRAPYPSSCAVRVSGQHNGGCLSFPLSLTTTAAPEGPCEPVCATPGGIRFRYGGKTRAPSDRLPARDAVDGSLTESASPGPRFVARTHRHRPWNLPLLMRNLIVLPLSSSRVRGRGPRGEAGGRVRPGFDPADQREGLGGAFRVGRLGFHTARPWRRRLAVRDPPRQDQVREFGELVGDRQRLRRECRGAAHRDSRLARLVFAYSPAGIPDETLRMPGAVPQGRFDGRLWDERDSCR